MATATVIALIALVGFAASIVRERTLRHQRDSAVEALHRAHAALDKGHEHTAQTWADRARFDGRQ